MDMARALILGAEGQDGHFLKSKLLSSGYEVLCTVKDQSRLPASSSMQNVQYSQLDIRDTLKFEKLVTEFKPNSIYNFAGVSSVAKSFQEPKLTMDVNFNALANILKTLMRIDNRNQIGFFQASSSEMFGNVDGVVSENTPLNPLSPYAESKALAHEFSVLMRNKHGMKITCGILFNHESEVRPKTFVFRKITSGFANIQSLNMKRISLGNLDISRDWGYAPDFITAIQALVEGNFWDDFVVATGESNSLKQIVQLCIDYLRLPGALSQYIELDENLIRNQELYSIVGSSEKIRNLTGWKPSIVFNEMVARILNFDLIEISRGKNE